MILKVYDFQTFIPGKYSKVSIQKLAVTLLKHLSLVSGSKVHLTVVKVDFKTLVICYFSSPIPVIVVVKNP